MALRGISPHQEVDTDPRLSGIQAQRGDDTALLTRTEDQCQLDIGIEMDLLRAGNSTDPTRMILTKTEDALMKKRDNSFGTADLQRDVDLWQITAEAGTDRWMVGFSICFGIGK